MIGNRRIDRRNDQGNQRRHTGTARRHGQIKIQLTASVKEDLSCVCRLYEITDIRLDSESFLRPLVNLGEHHSIAAEIILEDCKRCIHEILRIISTLALQNIYGKKR